MIRILAVFNNPQGLPVGYRVTNEATWQVSDVDPLQLWRLVDEWGSVGFHFTNEPKLVFTAFDPKRLPVMIEGQPVIQPERFYVRSATFDPRGNFVGYRLISTDGGPVIISEDQVEAYRPRILGVRSLPSSKGDESLALLNGHIPSYHVKPQEHQNPPKTTFFNSYLMRLASHGKHVLFPLEAGRVTTEVRYVGWYDEAAQGFWVKNSKREGRLIAIDDLNDNFRLARPYVLTQDQANTYLKLPATQTPYGVANSLFIEKKLRHAEEGFSIRGSYYEMAANQVHQGVFFFSLDGSIVFAPREGKGVKRSRILVPAHELESFISLSPEG